MTTRTQGRSRCAHSNLSLEYLEPRQLLAADVILEWNSVMLNANAADHSVASPEQGGPILTARAFAIVSAAMYDAYNSVEHIGKAYLVTVPNAAKADSDAAAAQAAHDALAALYPHQTSTFDAALTKTLSRIRDGSQEIRGRAVGALVASTILGGRANDGSQNINATPYIASGLPGFHNVDPLHPNQPFYGVGAVDIEPFAVQSTDQFEARRLDDGTPAGRLAFLNSQEYTDAYNEVIAFGGDGIDTPTQRTAEQTQIGIYWAYDGQPGLGTPPRLYNQIAQTIAKNQHNTEADNARMFALVNIAMADAGFTAWNNKYDDTFWRPILGIRNGNADGNPATTGAANWTPLGAQASNQPAGVTNFTPPFPAYTSGHSTFGAAVFQTIADFYGTDKISFRFVSDELNGVTTGADGKARPKIVRSFHNLTQAKLENAQSRIYLGIHWRFDADEGIKTGDAVADYVFANFLQPNAKPGGGHHTPNNPKPGDSVGVGGTLVQCDANQSQTPSNLTRSTTVPTSATSNPLTDMVFERIGAASNTTASSTSPLKVQRTTNSAAVTALEQSVRAALNLKTI